jgi:hypothetical protein
MPEVEQGTECEAKENIPGKNSATDSPALMHCFPPPTGWGIVHDIVMDKCKAVQELDCNGCIETTAW